ncbi:glycerol-3-phosphate dehydrogenase/oxidase [Massilia sp. PAMC28688]|uniref:glycerol-3-phosphate dehydrogenase/oxidase n=1 Tax=Massilia sp. PAMC28688 TaxID=2861283 RepID=UPI001C626250|nr:glycerol-3-phosphate dehydrogenase/oxidase [Massilia sp. PAMC28688]QYF92467.1 glycerol-3-phosphate dehydrogenase/oxidase [Massilia sp. PAMC28688]
MNGGWARGWRAGIPALAEREWDLLIIGGGITGAGILLEAARRGLRAVLVEQRDFAWGTSSRSSKLVHGGLRYLKQGRFGLTRESVRERNALMREACGLVEPQSFAFGDYHGARPGRRMFLLGLAIYDLLSGRRERHYSSVTDFLMLAPNVGRAGLQGGMSYTDAKTDDARLVLRVLQEARSHGGVAVNYMAARTLIREGERVVGARLEDGIDGAAIDIRAQVVVSATGAWADQLRGQTGAGKKIRPLRGSHLIFPAWRLPLAQAVSLMHPADGRPVFAYPWEGVTLVGTTDVDHSASLATEAAITRAEVDYLMLALECQFPQQGLGDGDILATFAGVRPVIDSGQADPSKEGRDHAVWMDQGLLTVTGGKLTTFRVIALDALRHARSQLPHWRDDLAPCPVFAPSPWHSMRVRGTQRQRLEGRHGAAAAALVAAALPGELEPIPGTQTLWAELRWAARCEAVMHLEDLLLRRTRLGLQLRGGGVDLLPRIRATCQGELGWSDAQWETSQAAYLALWNANYSLPT